MHYVKPRFIVITVIGSKLLVKKVCAMYWWGLAMWQSMGQFIHGKLTSVPWREIIGVFIIILFHQPVWKISTNEKDSLNSAHLLTHLQYLTSSTYNVVKKFFISTHLEWNFSFQSQPEMHIFGIFLREGFKMNPSLSINRYPGILFPA